MHKVKRLSGLCALLTVAVLVISGCQAEPEVIEKEVTREVKVEVEKQVTVVVPEEVTRVVEKEVIVEVEAEPVAEIPFAAMWVGSGHADAGAAPRPGARAVERRRSQGTAERRAPRGRALHGRALG